MKLKPSLFILATCVGLSSCYVSKPVIMELTKDSKERQGCECIYGVDKHYSSLEEFLIYNKKDVIKENKKGCRCDTIFMDISDIWNMRKYESLTYWGLGVSCDRQKAH